jgi:hypothetical protein
MRNFSTESSEDISPYATFQLSEASTLAQGHPGPANTLLHSFMYHERAMTEGCASPPPPQVLRQLHNQSPYYNIVRLFFLDWTVLILDKINFHITCSLPIEFSIVN